MIAVEDPRRRVGHAGQRHRLGVRGQRLDEPEAATAAGDDEAQLRAGRDLGRLEQRERVGADRVDVERQAEVARPSAPSARGGRRRRRASRRRGARPRRRRRRAAGPRRSRGRSPPPPARGRRRRWRARRDSTRGGGRPGALPHLEVGLGAVGHVVDDLLAGDLAQVLDPVGVQAVVVDAVGVDVVRARARTCWRSITRAAVERAERVADRVLRRRRGAAGPGRRGR